MEWYYEKCYPKALKTSSNMVLNQASSAEELTSAKYEKVDVLHVSVIELLVYKQ